jgi:MFS family permease
MSEITVAGSHPAARRSLKARLLSPQGVMLGTLCVMYMITYIDRVNLATAAPFVQKELGLSPVELGLVFSAFAIPYGFLQPLGGWLGDRFGPRWVLFSAGLVWAAATVMTGLSVGVVTLFIARLLLGLGEGATFPTATKAMAIWLPPHKRAFAQGITHSFARLGNAIAPPLVGYMIVGYGWRMPFYVLGGVSFAWVAWWVYSFRNNPHADPAMLPGELAELPPAAATAGRVIPWAQLIRRILPVTLVDFCYGWTLWVYLTWLPSFLASEWQLPLGKFVWFSSAILFAGVIGDTVGGVLSDAILKRTGNLRTARRFNLVVGLLGSLLLLLPCLFVHDLIIVSVCLSLAFFFLELTNAVLWALPMDIAPSYAGIAGGLMNTGFGVAGVLSPVVFGALLQLTGSWQVPFATSVVLLLIGVVLSLRIDPTVEVKAQ